MDSFNKKIDDLQDKISGAEACPKWLMIAAVSVGALAGFLIGLLF